LWPGIEVTLRSKRVAEVIEQHDEYLRRRGWYDVITATLDENWIDDAVDGSSTPTTPTDRYDPIGIGPLETRSGDILQWLRTSATYRQGPNIDGLAIAGNQRGGDR